MFLDTPSALNGLAREEYSSNDIASSSKKPNDMERNSVAESILIKNGKILKTGKITSYPDNTLVLDCREKIVCPGFIDIRSNIDFLNRTDRESLLSASATSMSGGYTKVCIATDINAPLDTPELILAFFDKVKDSPVDFLPYGAITKGAKGNELAEIGMMIENGAVAISDGTNNLKNSLLVRYALEYLKPYNKPFMNSCYDTYLSHNTFMNEGDASAVMGVSCAPDISESIAAYRDLSIANYVNGNIHVPLISSSKTIDLILKFSNKNFSPSFDVPVSNLYFSDEDMLSFNNNLRVHPPLRSADNRKK